MKKEQENAQLRPHKIELDPNNKQKTLFAKHAGYARVAFNFALSSFQAGQKQGEWRSHVDIKREFNAVKADLLPWCSELSQNASKNAIHNFGDASTRWKKGQNQFPVRKKRSGKISYQADNGEGTVDVYKKRIKLPKIGWVRMREELRWSGEITKVVISKRNGKWFASITVRNLDSNNYNHQPSLFEKHEKEPIGIDVGINTLATCSNGDTYDNPRPLKRYERKLARTNRALSRKMLRSNNWHKANKRLGRVHERIGNIREDAHQQATTKIVRKASAIGVETLNISGLVKNRKLAKALSDSALSRFLTMLKYKADRRKIHVDEADRFFASSKTCSGCGHKQDDLTLSDRKYHCDACGLEIDRDLNAAINLCPS